MANAIAVAAIVLAAVFAARKQFRKGQWTKSCVGCAGHCSCGAGAGHCGGGCGGGCGHCGGSHGKAGGNSQAQG